jgi:PPOX class probable F420-dependent enzyme
MRLPEPEARHRLTQARVAHLATVTPTSRPHLVPVTFALHNETIVIAVDHKPKSTRDLQRLTNIRANPQVSVLADEYSEDWTRLWWVRADGTATITETPDPTLVAKYPQYQAHPPQGPFIYVHIDAITAWSAL